MQLLAGIITESEFYDYDSANTDTYGDTSYEDNWDDNQDAEDEEYADAEIIDGELVDERGDEYSDYEIFDTRAELEQAMKVGIYPQRQVIITYPMVQ